MSNLTFIFDFKLQAVYKSSSELPTGPAEKHFIR
jgi:hypothetical protein